MGTIFESRTHPYNTRELLLRRSELNKAIVENLDSDANETTDLLIKCGALAAYATFEVSSSNLGIARVWEGGNISTSGATIVPYINLNRNHINSAGATLTSLGAVAYSSPTVTNTDDSTLLWIEPTNGTVAQETIVLKPNTSYLVRHTSSAANAVVGLTAIIAE
jgi:hypothetical protein